MAVDGPGGLRLMNVAKAAGVSHPTILHHFGNREGLIRALNRRTAEELKRVLVSTMQSGQASTAELVGPTFDAYRNGLAQRLAWMLQAEPEASPGALPILDEIVAELQALRVRRAGPGAVVDEVETRRWVHLVTVVAFGDAIIGRRLRAAGDPAEERAARDAFERWFVALMER